MDGADGVNGAPGNKGKREGEDGERGILAEIRQATYFFQEGMALREGLERTEERAKMPTPSTVPLSPTPQSGMTARYFCR
jgi:hypothetical protein